MWSWLVGGSARPQPARPDRLPVRAPRPWHRPILHQQGLDTTTPAGKAMFQMLGVFAEFERSMIKERVRAGLARAKAAGTKLGRPSLPQAKEDAIRAALSQPGRPGVRKIASRFGVDPSNVQRISNRWAEGGLSRTDSEQFRSAPRICRQDCGSLTTVAE